MRPYQRGSGGEMRE